MKRGAGSCFGTFGELVQGEVNNHPFLFTFPVPLKSRAIFVPASDTKEISCTPHKEKMTAAARLTLEKIGIGTGGCLYSYSQIPIGKGMASSSADITAAIRAVAASFGTIFAPSDIAAIAAAIEPTDGVMYEGINAFNQQTGERLQSFPEAPDLFLIGYDSGGTVNTDDCYSSKRVYTPNEKAELQQLYNGISTALLSGKIDDIMLAATKSAGINERFLPKPFFSLFKEIASRFEAGIIIGHSGTVIGFLLSGNDHLLIKKVQEIKGIVQQMTGWNPFIMTSFPIGDAND
ncbi:hypothetical protein QYG89_00160 [Bacillus sp. B190/17]|uniref:GHMP kinase N-terminal domain-containing protein n=1 Tax=Bacillus lumedeiriae TaxID=3058829 RepID=A0ABW8I3U5_9BACI